MGRLASVTTGKLAAPVVTMIYGVDGVGKTTFGAEAPEPIFIGTEKGTRGLNVARLPVPTTFNSLILDIESLATEEHSYKTIVIDSLDWLERQIIWPAVCIDDGKSNIEDVGGGFAKGYVVALTYWERLRATLEKAREKRGMGIVLIAHAEIKSFTDPETTHQWDRYQVKLHAKAAALWREFTDAVLFARYDVAVIKDGKKTKAKATGEDDRVMYTQHRPSFDAKNRFNLPFKMKLDYGQYATLVRAHEERGPEDVAKSCAELLPAVKDEEKRKIAEGAVTAAAGNLNRLLILERRLREIVE
jgi:hypothetical protein